MQIQKPVECICEEESANTRVGNQVRSMCFRRLLGTANYEPNSHIKFVTQSLDNENKSFHRSYIKANNNAEILNPLF
jgi:hypothetical protein